MKVSYNWLKDYVTTDLSPEQVSEILTNTGLEVEGVEHFETVKGGLEGLMIGQVTSCAKHPDADKLSITTVNIGAENDLPIVCGAPNVAQGQKVVVATVGTTLYMNDDSFKIKKAKIRGEVSEGMICAEDEIGLGTSHDGIMVLDSDAKIGMLAKDYFKIEKDVVFEIGLTPNRIDGASHIGTARDLVAFLRQENPAIILNKPSVDDFSVDNKDLPIEIVVEDPEACPRYSGVSVTGVKIEQSPDWLQNRLKAVGLKPINNVVDISNFVLHETGQPLHFFDADKIDGKKVIIKCLEKGSKFTTLDEQKRELSDKDLMICDTAGGMCIAGVFGGIKSGVSDTTKDIFIESAHFNSVYIRKTAKLHDLHTDASFRFERGSDPNATIYALKRAAILLKEIAGGKISSDIIDVYPEPLKDYKVDLTFKNLARLIGQEIEKSKVKSILAALDIKVILEDAEKLSLEVPTYRVDVRREVDVIEEVLRIYGYNNIHIGEHVNSSLSYLIHPDKEKINNTISDILAGNGFNEIMCNSLSKSSYYNDLDSYKSENLVEIFNPLSNDLNIMRQTLLFGGLESIAYNQNRKNPNLRLFEIGNCYFNKKTNDDNPLKKYEEELHLAIFVTGQKETANWTTSDTLTDFYYTKSYIESIMERLGFNLRDITKKETNSDIITEGIEYSINNQTVAQFGIVSNKILKSFDIDNQVYYADFEWGRLIKYSAKNKVKYTELPKYPAVKRDLALLVDKNIRFQQLEELAFKTEKKLLKNVFLFDVYVGEKLGENKKSYALSFVLQDETKTLTDKVIDKIMNNFVRVFEQNLGAQLR